MITLKLPKTDPLFSNRPYSQKAVDSLFSLVKSRTSPQALILRADFSDICLVLFILENKPFAAGKFAEDRFWPLSLNSFFKTLAGSKDALLRLDAVNPIFFKCLLVTVQKLPTTTGTTDMVNVEALLEKVMSSKNESVVTVRSGNTYNFFFFIDGKLRETCFVDPSFVSTDTSPEDRFLEFVYKLSSDSKVLLQTYEDVKVDPAEDSDLDWEDASEGVVAYYLRPRPELVFLSGGTITKKTINKKIFTFGRGQDNDIWLPDTKASRDHAAIIEKDGRFLLQDKESRNGTQVNKQKISEVSLNDGDEIFIGNTRILFTHQSEKGSGPESDDLMELETTAIELPEGTPATDQGSQARSNIVLSLRFGNGPQKGLTVPLPDKLLIGRTRSDINLNDSKVSRHHASIEKKGKGYEFTDLNSTNGSLINDQLIKSRILIPGDIIKLGETLLEVIERDS